MKNTTTNTVRAGLLLFAMIQGSALFAQQNITMDKNDTRPEITRQFTQPAMITGFSAVEYNGYNEIQWTASGEQDTRILIVEYSDNGVYFQSAGEALSTTGFYQLKHQTFETSPLLYRVKIEDKEGRFSYSPSVLLGGIDVHLVKVYPTIITGNTVNVIATFPVERIDVFNGSGQRVFSKEIAGRDESLTVVLPSLGKGMYWMHFSGRAGWKTTEKIIIP